MNRRRELQIRKRISRITASVRELRELEGAEPPNLEPPVDYPRGGLFFFDPEIDFPDYDELRNKVTR